MAIRLFAAILCLVMLCSCSPITINPEDLLEPPRFDQRQAKVEAALDTALGLGAITYKYPQSGGHRSPFVFYNIDQDDREEAVVFFTYNSDTENVRAKILKETESGDWSIIYDLSGPGDQVDFIQFAPVLDADSNCILVGWHNTRGAATLSVYSYAEDSFHREIEMNYHSLNADDYLGDGLTEISLVYQDFSDSYQLVLLGRRADGKLAALGEVSLSEEAADVLQVCNSLLWNGSRAVFVDETCFDGQTATEVFEVTQNGLVPVVSAETYELYEQTFRADPMLSTDLRGGGMLAIPVMSELPGYVSDLELPPPMLITYIRPSANGTFTVVERAVINEDAGYMFSFPARWLENVTILRSPDYNEWRFHKVNPATNTNLLGDELLRIRVHNVRSYRDRFIDDYITLAEKGLFQYYADLPFLPSEPLAITEAELRRFFKLL